MSPTWRGCDNVWREATRRRDGAALARVSLVLLAAWAPALTASTIRIPITLDTAFIGAALATALSADSAQPTSVWSDGSGCNYLKLSNAKVSVVARQLRLQANSSARVGTQISNTQCIVALDWSGISQLDHRPVLSADGRRIRFQVVDSRLLDSGAALSSQAVWNLLKQHIHPRIEAFEIDLNPAVAELSAVLGLFLPHADEAHANAILKSIRLDELQVIDDGVRVQMLVTAPPLEQSPAAADEPALTDVEMTRWRQRSQAVDTFITVIVKAAAGATDSSELRAQLLDVLIDARYAIEHALQRADESGADPVRQLFIRSWRRLAPVLARIGSQETGRQSLNFFAFIAAGDALAALDELGPASGIDISTNGLRRLARLFVNEDVDLDFNEQVDPLLRELFLFGPAPRAAAPRARLWFAGLIGTAQAASAVTRVGGKQLDGWAPNAQDAAEYLPLAADLLRATAADTLQSHPVDAVFAEVFEPLVLATAWQESCWRQWVVKDGKPATVTSSAGAVGMMQVLPRVWRGFYDPQLLNRDIGYNAAAGAEILSLYLTRYAIERREYEHSGGLNNLARATYAAYNGGPRHLTRYRDADTSESLRRIDAAFLDKYEAMRAAQYDAVLSCFGL